MSERERWVVYPLLFLALGASLRDKLSDRTTSRSIKCQELLVIDEQPFGQEVLLARIGRASPTAPDGQILVNGQIQVLDGHLANNQVVRPLVTIGRAPFGPQGAMGGFVRVDGQISVNGIINATLYAYQGTPMVPALRGAIPGTSLPAEMMRAIPEVLSSPPSDESTESAPAEKSTDKPQSLPAEEAAADE